MIRQIIHIDEEKCNGCGLCAHACHEGAIDMVNGKAKLVRENFCDGFGDCLPNCPTGAITFENREAPAYDQAAVAAVKASVAGSAATNGNAAVGTDHQAAADRKSSAEESSQTKSNFRIDAQQGGAQKSGVQQSAVQQGQRPSGCPGSRIQQFVRSPRVEGRMNGCPGSQPAALKAGTGSDSSANANAVGGAGAGTNVSASANGGASANGSAGVGVGASAGVVRPQSELRQWPVQIKLLPTEAPFYNGAKLLIAADCTAYSYAKMHEDFMRGRITLIGCPKLDMVDYYDKLKVIFEKNNIKSVTVVRMEVPCCGGLQRAAEDALKASGKFIPWRVVTISRDGRILDD